MSIKISLNLSPVAASLAAPVSSVVTGAHGSRNVAGAPVTCMVGAAPLEPALANPETALS